MTPMLASISVFPVNKTDGEKNIIGHHHGWFVQIEIYMHRQMCFVFK